jgi:hypothetical protein
MYALFPVPSTLEWALGLAGQILQGPVLRQCESFPHHITLAQSIPPMPGKYAALHRRRRYESPGKFQGGACQKPGSCVFRGECCGLQTHPTSLLGDRSMESESSNGRRTGSMGFMASWLHGLIHNALSPHSARSGVG